MASQLRRVTGNPALRPNARAGLQAKIAMLPQMLAQQQQRDLIKRDTAFQNKQLALQKGQMSQRKREQEAAMGLEAAKFGFNLGTSDIGKKTIGDVGASVKGVFSGKPYKAAEGRYGKMFEGVNVGGALASGLTGYGVGKLVGGKSKLKKAGYGAGAGALMGLLSSGKGGGFGGALAGGLTGGLGGYFS